MTTLERSGSRDRTVRRQEARTRQTTDGLGSRLDSLEQGSPGVLADLALTTTPQRFEHGLRRVANAADLATSRAIAAAPKYVGRVPDGAHVIRGHGSFHLVVGARGERFIELSISTGSATVTVQVV